MDDLYRVCVKLYASERSGAVDDAVFVEIFQEWIRDRALDMVLFDVADYAHAPISPGIMLITDEANFALDRADGHFGLLGQRRKPIVGDAVAAISTTVAQVMEIADRLERDPRVGGKLEFERSSLRIESNDRLRAPNTDEGYAGFEMLTRAALERVRPQGDVRLSRVGNDPRDRLAVEAKL